MSIKEIILAGAVGLAALVGCDNPSGEISKAYTEKASKIEFRMDESITNILTQITDVQEGSVPYMNYEGHQGYGKERIFKYIEVKGGDVKRLVLIYPYPAYFQKFVPARIRYKKLPLGKISSKDFVEKYVGTEKFYNSDMFPICADGIIEPEGVEYPGEGK